MTPALGYSKMKESGVQWLGYYPAHWNLGKVKNVFSSTKTIVGDDVDNYERLALTLNGVIKRSKTDVGGLQPEKFETYQILRENELVFKLIDLQNVATSRVGRSPYTGIVSPAYIILHERSGRSTKYAEYYFLSMWMHHVFNQLGADGVRSNIGASALLNIPFLIPPENEQKAIVTYLDTQCAKIDEIIIEVKASIEDYKKWKASIIYEAVTKGLNPDVEMKDSGVEWIGKIPGHWQLSRIKNALENLDHLREPISAENRDNKIGLYDYYGASGVIDKIDDFNVNDTVLLIGEDGANLRMRNLPLVYRASGKFWVNNHAHILKPKQGYSYGFLAYALEAGDYNTYITGAAQPKLSQSNLMRFPIAIPPYKEQMQIEQHLDVQCAQFDGLLEEKQALISELESYKKSLIYEVTTGKRRVC